MSLIAWVVSDLPSSQSNHGRGKDDRKQLPSVVALKKNSLQPAEATPAGSLGLGHQAPLRDVDAIKELADVKTADEARLTDERTRPRDILLVAANNNELVLDGFGA